MQPPEGFEDLLRRPVFAHFGTVAADCTPRVNPMWFLWDAEAQRFRLTHTKTRHNYRNLQERPHVALSVADPENSYRYVQARGTVENIEDDPSGDFYNVLCQRYRGHTIEVKDRDVRVILTIRPTGWKARPG